MEITFKMINQTTIGIAINGKYPSYATNTNGVREVWNFKTGKKITMPRKSYSLSGQKGMDIFIADFKEVCPDCKDAVAHTTFTTF